MWKPDYVDLIGVPFEPFGRGPRSYDCLGLVIEAGRRMGVPIPDYGSEDPEDLEAVSLKVNGARVDFEEVATPSRGDLVEFSTLAMEVPEWHMGIMVTDDICLHTTARTGARAAPISRLNSKITHQIARFWRCKKTASD